MGRISVTKIFLCLWGGESVTTELLRTDSSSWDIGPYHVALPGPLRLRLHSDGEIVVKAEFETGFLHRGLEKCLEGQAWISSVAYADHLDPEAAVFGEAALCLAAEEIGKIPVPPRAQVIRMILLELARISSHLLFVSRVANSVGAETAVQYSLRDRERILDLFELVSGVRFSLNFLRFGGVAADVTEGFIERVGEVGESIYRRLKEYNDLFTFSHAFLLRSAGVGVLSRKEVIRWGVSGPNARASGIRQDLRKTAPYSGYDTVDFEMVVGNEEEGLLGDVHGRFMIRLREIAQSIEILKQVCHAPPQGEYSSIRVDRRFRLPRGEAYARIESARGILGCHLVSDGGPKPARVQFRVPSASAIHALPAILTGMRAEDAPPILASVDLSVAENDR